MLHLLVKEKRAEMEQGIFSILLKHEHCRNYTY